MDAGNVDSFIAGTYMITSGIFLYIVAALVWFGNPLAFLCRSRDTVNGTEMNDSRRAAATYTNPTFNGGNNLKAESGSQGVDRCKKCNAQTKWCKCDVRQGTGDAGDVAQPPALNLASRASGKHSVAAKGVVATTSSEAPSKENEIKAKRRMSIELGTVDTGIDL